MEFELEKFVRNMGGNLNFPVPENVKWSTPPGSGQRQAAVFWRAGSRSHGHRPSDVEATYARSDLFERQLLLMDDWPSYVVRGCTRDGSAAALDAGAV